MNNNYEIEYENSSSQNLYNDGEDKKPKLVLIIGGIILLVVLILIFFFACSVKDKKSENNFLTSISVSNGEINPQFEKNELNYSIAVTENFTTVSCSAEDSKALTDGCNKRIYLMEECIKHSVKVTSESGALREYNLNICKQSKEAPIIKKVKIFPEGYTKENITVSVEAESNNELNQEAYSFNGGKTWQSSNKITIKENTTLEIRVRDKNNNESASIIKEIKNIDRTTPTVKIKGSIDSGKTTTSNVVLTAVVSPAKTESGYNYQWYKGNSEIKNATKSTYTATSSGNYKVKVTTGSGITKTSDAFVVNKKTNTNPSKDTVTIKKVSGNAESWTSKIKLTVTASATSGLHDKAYSFDGEKTWQTSNSKEFTKNQTVNIVVRDKKGNKDYYKVYITKIDATKPTITINGNNTVGSKLTVSVNPSKTDSGYKYQWYCNDKIITNGTTDSYIAQKEGTYKIKVTTGAGISSEKTVTIKQDIPGNVSLSSSTASGVWTNKNVTLTATAVNKKVKQYNWYKGTDKVATTTTNTYQITKDENASYKVEAVFSDGSKKSSSAITVRIDKTAPTLRIDPRLNSYIGSAYTPGTWTNKNIYINVSATDNQSLSNLQFQYLEGDTSWYGHATKAWASKRISGKNGTATIKFDSNRNYYFTVKAKDAAGNETIKKIETKIDKTPPYTPYVTKEQAFNYNIACTVNNKETLLEAQTKDLRLCMGSTSDYNLNVEVKDDGGSGIAGCQYVLSESGSNGKNYGDIGSMKIDTNTGKVSGYDTINWVNGYGPGVAINSKSILYLRRCYDRAGNYSNAIFLLWLIKN